MPLNHAVKVYYAMPNILDKKPKTDLVGDGMFKFLKEIQDGVDILTSTTKNGFYMCHGETMHGIILYGSPIAETMIFSSFINHNTIIKAIYQRSFPQISPQYLFLISKLNFIILPIDLIN